MCAQKKKHEDTMSIESLKHQLFVKESMKEKLVTDLPGIGRVHGQRLRDKGFEKAYSVLGQFLLLEMDRAKFVDWLICTSGAKSNEQTACFNCLKEWCENFL